MRAVASFDDSRVHCWLKQTMGTIEARVQTVVADRYRIDRLLGSGGMGAVYEATHLHLGAKFALKVLHARFASDESFVERFRREAQRVAELKVPGIVRVMDLGQTTDGTPFMAMELLEGSTLESWISLGPMDLDHAVRLTLGMLKALGAAHEAGVIHRDLKPANLFVIEEDGRPDSIKILDFGVAKVEDDPKALTQTGHMMGTVAYMSPEQIRNAKHVDARADLYATGATLFEMLTGRPPAEADSIPEMSVKVGTGEIERLPHLLREEIPFDLSSVVARALAFEPDQRFASAEDMSAALRVAWEHDEPSGLVAHPSPQAPSRESQAPILLDRPAAKPEVHSMVKTVPPEIRLRAGEPKRETKKKARWVPFGLLGLAAFAAGFWVVQQRRQAQGRTPVTRVRSSAVYVETGSPQDSPSASPSTLPELPPVGAPTPDPSFLEDPALDDAPESDDPKERSGKSSRTSSSHPDRETTERTSSRRDDVSLDSVSDTTTPGHLILEPSSDSRLGSAPVESASRGSTQSDAPPAESGPAESGPAESGSSAELASPRPEDSTGSAAAGSSSSSSTSSSSTSSSSTKPEPSTPPTEELERAFGKLNRALTRCVQGQRATVDVAVTLSGLTGRPSEVAARPPFEGTDAGRCIEQVIRVLSVAPFGKESFKLVRRIEFLTTAAPSN